MEAYRDVGYKSLPDGICSCRGCAIVIANTKMNAAGLVSRRSKKLKIIVAD